MTPAVEQFRLRPEHLLYRVRRIALGAGIVGVVLCAVGAFASPAQFLRSYLVAYVFWTGAALGSLAILMINYLTGGAWGAVIRRALESATRTLPLMAVLFFPVALGLSRLYTWAQPDVVAHDPLLQHKSLYLNVPFFLARTVLYFTAWIVVASFLNRWSLEQDARPDPATDHRLEQLSRGGLVLLGLTMTFAAVDWIMSLQPHWFSTIFGIIFMGGSVVTALAFAIPIAAVLADQKPLGGIITPTQFHDLGKLLLAFVMLWAYFALSQFLIIWAGNLPEEIPWYLDRLRGGWQWVALAVVVFHFVLPFVVLLSRKAKRRPHVLAALALFLVALRFVDVYWLVTPAFSPGRIAVHWLDAAALLAIGGLWLATYVQRLVEHPVVPLNDPSLPLEV